MKQTIKDVYNVLHNSNIGKTLHYGHLHYKHTMQTDFILGDHTYSKIPLYDKNIINIPTVRKKSSKSES